jgi:hypothetical protein
MSFTIEEKVVQKITMNHCFMIYHEIMKKAREFVMISCFFMNHESES